MVDIITRIITEFEDTLYDMRRAHAILLDLAPEKRRECILVRCFVELGGYEILQECETADYPLTEKKLVQGMVETFSMQQNAAFWAVRLFGAAMGFVQPDEMPLGDSSIAAPTEQITYGYIQGQVAIGKSHVIAVATDGTVWAGGFNTDFQCDISGWHNIVAVAAGDSHSLGLMSNGTVLAAGSNAFDQCDVGDKTNVRAIYAFGNDSICVMADGTAEAAGRSKLNLSKFSEIVGIAPYPEGIIGIRADGTITLAGYTTEEEMAHENDWLLQQKDVAQVVSTYIHGSIIRTKSGRLLKSGQPESYFAQWRDIIDIVNLFDSFAILGKDGTVRVLPYEREKPRIVTAADKWRNITAIFGMYKRLIGLTRDGTLLTAYTDPEWPRRNKPMSVDYVTSWYPVGVDLGANHG